jgi:tetratricopeptide (TPR) repeat protein
MSLRFWQRIRLAPGVTLNLSKSTASLSFGPRGAQYTISPRGNRATLGLPGTGLFYTVHNPGGRASRGVPKKDRLSLGFFQRLMTPTDERHFVDGLRALNAGDDDTALAAFEAAPDLPDAAWMAGMIRLRREDFAQARTHFSRALAGLSTLGTLFDKYEIAAQVGLPIADGVYAHILPRERGTRLALVEIAQATGDRAGAMAHLDRLIALDATDPVVVLSFVELACDAPGDRALMSRVVALSAQTANETPIDTAILMYRARALVALGLSDAATEVLTVALRRRKDRPEALMHQIRHDRAMLYAQAGRAAQARREFEKLFAEAPDFPGLTARLGLSA